MGSDTGGSIRGPAAYNGIVGLKPTYGRVSRRGVFPNTFSMDHCGPLTRSAADIALFMQVIAGFDPEDPCSEDIPVPDYAAELNGGVRGLRLGLVEDWHQSAGAHADLAPAIEAAVARGDEPLGDPLLARLPGGTLESPMGHFPREVPKGYVDTIASGTNRIADPDLAAYYDRLHEIVAGPLWSAHRLALIPQFLAGRYNPSLDSYVRRTRIS
jgi:hypothetical protein